MKGKLLILLMSFSLFSCSTKKVSTEQVDYSRLVSEWRELAARYERRSEVYKDSLMMVKGLMEKSSNVADSISHLETSYALSDAAIRNGRLYHSIENKDSIPGRVQFVFIEVEKRDTLRVEKSDTVFIEKKVYAETVKEKKHLGDGFFYTSGWIAWVLTLAGCGIWFRYKVKKGEK
jgi:hypothetical protein|nr:MAG TPA: TRAF PROTEIN, TRAO PROTEIN, TRAN ADHESION, BACTERIAL SECRETION.5A [Caudoviricetes sp.]